MTWSYNTTKINRQCRATSLLLGLHCRWLLDLQVRSATSAHVATAPSSLSHQPARGAHLIMVCMYYPPATANIHLKTKSGVHEWPATQAYDYALILIGTDCDVCFFIGWLGCAMGFRGGLGVVPGHNFVVEVGDANTKSKSVAPLVPLPYCTMECAKTIGYVVWLSLASWLGQIPLAFFHGIKHSGTILCNENSQSIFWLP